MKKVPIIIALCATVCIFTGCNNNSYSADLKAEKELIEDYIKREGINVINEMPTNDADWGEKDYYKVKDYDYLYFHLTTRGKPYHINDKGDTIKTEAIKASETVVMRFRKYTLKVNADTADYWTTLDNAYPLEFSYQTDYNTAPVAWHIAVQLMEYSDSECKIICPSKLGFTDDQNTVTPYGYQIKMKIKR